MATGDIHFEYDRMKELKDFDETKAGVKGLVDAGVSVVPRIFICPPDELPLMSGDDQFQVPIIDLQGIESSDDDQRGKITKEMICASEKWGFFQVVNHGVPLDLLDRMIDGVRLFNEQDLEAKKELYNREPEKMVRFNSNYDLYKSGAANWRDSLTVVTQYTGNLESSELPSICRDVIVEYTSEAKKLGDALLELFSEGLGLKAEHHLGGMECTKGWTSVFHYYPACPEPDSTLGATKHTDPSFFTLLLQDEIGGLQVLHHNKWVKVNPIPGALVVNIGDLLQMITNDKLKSIEHRVAANRVGPRVSVAMFFTGIGTSSKVYRPVEELISLQNPPLYKEFTIGEFFKSFLSQSVGESRFDHFRV